MQVRMKLELVKQKTGDIPDSFSLNAILKSQERLPKNFCETNFAPRFYIEIRDANFV